VTATIRGVSDLREFLAQLPGNLEAKILRGALRAGAEVIAEGAREGTVSSEVRASIGTTTRVEKGIVTAKVQTKGPGAYLAPWEEFGTDPHFISVDGSQAGGMTVRRVNRKVRDKNDPLEAESLKINGKFVGATVHHPGAKKNAFMRNAVDTRSTAAIEAIGGYINTRLTKEGLAAPAPPESDDE